MAGEEPPSVAENGCVGTVPGLREEARTFFRLSPDELQARLGCFAVRRGQAHYRADVNYNLLTGEVERRLAAPRFDLTPISSFETVLQYGCSQRATLEPIGVPILRMSNLQADGWDYAVLKYVEINDDELARWRLERGDIVFNRTNSKELVGKCEVFDREGTWVFASYLMRLRVDRERVDPQFVAAFLSTRAGRVQIDRESRQIIGMSNINAEEIRTLRVPLPKLAKQRELLSALNTARAARRRKLKKAETLLGGLDAFVLEILGLTLPAPRDPNKPFAVRLREVRDGRLDPPAYTPFAIPSNPHQIPIRPLGRVAAIDSHTAPTQSDDSNIVPYVGLPECDLNDVREVTIRTYKEVRGRSVAHVGDILFARIEPSVFNKKYVFVEHLAGHDYAYLSTEFYAVRAQGDKYDQKYLYAMLLSAFVFNQVRGKTTGSSGRRRIDPDMFASLLIPWPDSSVRRRIAAEVSRRRDAARQLREQARSEWEDAKRVFEEKLLAGEKSSKRRVARG